MILTAVAINKIAVPILNKDVLRPLILKPFSSLENDNPSSLFIANANTIRIEVSATIAATPFNKDAVSSLARMRTATAKIAIESAIFFMASAFICHAFALSTLEKDLITFEVFLRIL